MLWSNLKKELEIAFATGNVPKPNRILLSERSGKDPELLEVKNALAGRRWTDVTNRIFAKYDLLPLLTDDAFLYYLPRGVLASLENAESSSGWSIEQCIYNLDPYASDGNLVASRVTKFQKLTAHQVRTIDEYFEAIRDVMPMVLLNPTSKRVRKYWERNAEGFSAHGGPP